MNMVFHKEHILSDAKQLLGDVFYALLLGEIETFSAKIHSVLCEAEKIWPVNTSQFLTGQIEIWRKLKAIELAYSRYHIYFEAYLTWGQTKPISNRFFRVGSKEGGSPFNRFLDIEEKKIIPWSFVQDTDKNVFQVTHISNFMILSLKQVEYVGGQKYDKVLMAAPYMFNPCENPISGAQKS